MREPFPFDAVLFDLDGTLLATERFWVQAARAGARRAFGELGIERRLPTAEEWMGLVGLPLAEGFDALFADLSAEARALVHARCVEEEHFALDSGAAALLPGVREALEELRARGVRMGIASNCAQRYLDGAMRNVGLGEYVSEARCLESRGVRTKADMVQDLLLTFGTRSAVMVGDRSGDRDAAHANGLPHVHLASGFAPRGETVECEAVIEDFGGLLPRLARRNAWILEALEALGCLGDSPPRAVGVCGPPGSGKSLFARDAARLLVARGVAAEVVDTDSGGVEHDDLDARLRAARGIALVVGEHLLRPDLRRALDRLVHLDAPDRLCVARLRARHAPLGERAELERAVERTLPAARALEREHDPRHVCDLALDGSNPLGPEADQR